MNKKQKEVQQAFLNAEKEVLEQLKKNYQDALDEINTKIAILLGRDDADMSHVMYQVVYQEALKKQVESALNTLQANEFETISDYLAKSYEDGYIGTMYDIQGQGIPIIMPMDQEQVVQAIQHETKLSEGLYKALGKDVKVLSKQIAGEITRGISSGQMYSEIARNIAGYAGISRNKAMRIARTEGHRIQCKATMDAQFKAKEKGADVVKQWDASLDGRTRPTHRKLDGQIRELDEEFEVNGNHAMMPSGFNKASEDINCRCALLQRARWALDESELETLKQRAEYFELDKTEDFADYKKKYLKAVESDRVRVSPQMTKPTNKNGDEITFDLESTKGDKWARSKERREKGKEFITQLANEYNSNLTSVVAGAKGVAGEVDLSGVMRLSNYAPETLTHEFAHAMTSSSRVKYGLADETEKAFMKELAKIRRKYMDEQHGNPKKGIKAKPEINISPYANADIDEFFAEAFTQAKLLQLGYELPKSFGTDTKYSMQVLELVDKYFKK